MATNEFLPFGTGTGANLITETAYSSLAARTAGFSTGVAASNQLNKVWRQSSTMASMIGQLIQASGQDALDDGNIPGLAAKFLTALNSQLALQTPIGSIMAYLNTPPPSGWAECNGSTQARVGDFAALFALIATFYGNGDGSGTTFSLPDFRASFLRGVDHGKGVDVNRALGSLQDWSTAAPKTTNADHRSVENGVSNLVSATNPSVIGFVRAAKGGEAVTVTNVDSAQPVPGEVDVINVTAGDAETRPRNNAVVWIIRYK